MNKKRTHHLVEQAISTFSLNLQGLSVLTEAATGYYMLTPLIAAMAGAVRVYALTRDSRFGKAEDVYNLTMNMAAEWNVDNKIEIFTDRDDERVGKADIVTNLGFVRPLDASFLRKLKKNAVIPLMWETWEYRAKDLDYEECKRLSIPVLGTDEHHPDLRIFEYIGHLALKLLFEAEIEVFLSNIVVFGRGEFADNTRKTLKAAGARVDYLQTHEDIIIERDKVFHCLEKSDAIVVIDHHSREELIGPKGKISVEDIVSINSGLTVVHICGAVSQTSLQEQGVKCWPQCFAPFGHMSVGADYLGPKPLIDLHTAGLRIGEELARLRMNGFDGLDAEKHILEKLSFADGFADYPEKDPLSS